MPRKSNLEKLEDAYESMRARAERAESRVERYEEALHAVLARCPGIHQTDQQTGETFAVMIGATLKKPKRG